ncbi:MAG: hypothetical protein Q4B12_08435 [Bowdeniella nasicola]|nr:hypothetical protein [Bowdeniella nasicola]
MTTVQHGAAEWVASRAMSPRLLSAVWAAWAWITTVAYVDSTPRALEPLVAMVPGNNVAWLWGIAALLLTIGAVVPPGCRGVAWARRARSTGLAIVAALLAAWAATYALDAVSDGTRFWVTAKNYGFLALLAMLTSPAVGRARAVPPRTREGGT